MMFLRRALGALVKGGVGATVLQTSACELSDPASREFILDEFVVPQAVRFFSDTVFFFLDKALIALTNML